jgi:hypothetical protein
VADFGPILSVQFDVEAVFGELVLRKSPQRRANGVGAAAAAAHRG